MEILPRIDRRTALKWMLTATTSVALAPYLARAQPAVRASRGYGTDPDLLKTYKPGELWPLTFTEAQRRTAAALSDVIIPADGESPAASTVGVVDFIDEWISAPYPQHVENRAIILPGLAWIDEEAGQRFGRTFAELGDGEKSAICDEICHPSDAAPQFKKAARFFALHRDLTASGFYTTPQGRKDIGYIGNTPLATFEGPPPEVLRAAGLA